MEHEARFDRIEAALETLAKAMPKLAAESSSAFANFNNSQHHTLDPIKLHDFRFTALAQSARDLIQSQSGTPEAPSAALALHPFARAGESKRTGLSGSVVRGSKKKAGAVQFAAAPALGVRCATPVFCVTVNPTCDCGVFSFRH